MLLSALGELCRELHASKLDCRSDKIDVRSEMLGQMISLMAPNILLPALRVLVHMILSGEETLRLRYGNLREKIAAVLAEPHAR